MDSQSQDNSSKKPAKSNMIQETKDTVAKLASEFNKSTRSIVAKLVREGVYVAAPRVTKTGAPVVRKSEIVAQIQDALGVELLMLSALKPQLLRYTATASAQIHSAFSSDSLGAIIIMNP